MGESPGDIDVSLFVLTVSPVRRRSSPPTHPGSVRNNTFRMRTPSSEKSAQVRYYSWIPWTSTTKGSWK